MYKRYRKWVIQYYRALRHPKRLRDSYVLRWLSSHFLDKSLWKPTRVSIAGGLALGFFFMMLMCPGQMTLAAIFAAIFRVNIPIAMLACWITNPLTMVPVTWWEIKIGSWALDAMGMTPPAEISWSEIKSILTQSQSVGEFFSRIKPWASSLYLGGFIAGLVLAIVGFISSFVLWDCFSFMRTKAHPKNAGSPASLPTSKR